MKTYSSSISSPYLPAQSLCHYLFPELNGHPKFPPGTPTFIDPINNRSLTRQDVLDQARRLAGGLRSIGMKRGDTVAVIGLNSLEWLNAVYGSMCAGLKVSPVNAAYTPTELLHQLSHSQVSLVFVDPAILPTLHKALELGRNTGFKLSSDRIVLLAAVAPTLQTDYKTVSRRWGEAQDPERFEKGAEHETAFMCYSSGTTGVAKGVETTHHNLTSQMQAYHPLYEPLVSGRDVVLGYLPFSHMYSLTILVLHILTVGVPLVVLPRFDEVAVLSAIQKYKVTWSLVVPPVLIALRNSSHLDDYDLTSLRGVMSAAAPLSEDLCKAVEARIPTLTITQAYGLTETSPLTHAMRITHARGRQGTVGQLLPTYEARLIDVETGKDVEVGEAGELWVRGPSVMKGYYNNPTATANTFEGRWFKTGDSARIDKEGYYSIVDRLKELIKYKGYQVAPAELEAMLLTHPDVADAAVIGIWVEDQATELPRAYVVPRSAIPKGREREDFSKEIVSWMSQHVAQHKRLRGGCVLIDTIPKSPSGKILRRNLRLLATEEDPVKAKL